MHQPCRLLIFLWELRYTQTVPRSRPSGRRILYAALTSVLILSTEITVTFVSEYNTIASVFSVCSGKGAVTRGCNHCGASPARRGELQLSAKARTTTGFTRSIARSRGSSLQHNLSFIAAPYYLKEVSKRRIVLRIQKQNVDRQLSRYMQHTVVAIYAEVIRNNVPILFLCRWHVTYLPVARKSNTHVVRFFDRIFEIDRMNAVFLIKQTLLAA